MHSTESKILLVDMIPIFTWKINFPFNKTITTTEDHPVVVIDSNSD